MTDRLFTDETIKKHIEKYGREDYIKSINKKLEKWEEEYQRWKKQLTHILKRIENNFK